jgi:alkanesulfonate monooxygenase SsuD/methylene tetrahydromethanopterin reductase-like flavin-dependent oxidoreductase (luciferase family)
MRVAIGFGAANEDWDRPSAFVQEAEHLGVDFAWSAETWGHDAATPIGYIAAKTTRIRLGTGIMQVAARTPANIAMLSMSLASMSKDRFVLGLGASGPQVVEGWHGVPFKGTQQRLRETVDIVRIITRGERLVYNGKYFTLPLPGARKALKSGGSPEHPHLSGDAEPEGVPDDGEIADGWLERRSSRSTRRVLRAHQAGAERRRRLTDTRTRRWRPARRFRRREAIRADRGWRSPGR